MLVTKESMCDFIATRDREVVEQYVGRALVAIFNRQTEDEKDTNNTSVHNMMGFTGADAHGGCLTAKYFLKHKHLGSGYNSSWRFDKWVKKNSKGAPRIAKYWKQLNEVAEEKAVKSEGPRPKQSRAHYASRVRAQQIISMKEMFTDHERQMEANAYLAEEGLL